MLSSRYLASTKNLEAILQKIQKGTAPDKFTISHLKGLGFGSSNDRGVIPLLKDLGFLEDDGTPTQRYHQFRDTSRSPHVLGEALRETYSDLFHINERISETDRPAVEGKFKSTHNTSDRVAQLQAMTFFALLRHADLSEAKDTGAVGNDEDQGSQEQGVNHRPPAVNEPRRNQAVELRYNIEVHLPATKDIEVYHAIFRSLKEHIID